MEHPVGEKGAGSSDLEIAGVRLDRRALQVKFVTQLLREGMSQFEIRPELDNFILAQQWTPLAPLAWCGIVQSALQVLQQIKENEATEPDEIEGVCLSEVADEPVRWLWPGKIPLGKVTVICGAAGLGKTSWSLDLAARVSVGAAWPDGSSGPEPGRVLLLNAEDSLGEMVRPHLEGGGAKLHKITALRRMSSGLKAGPTVERDFDLARDIPALRLRVEMLGTVRLVIIDSLEAYCGVAGQRSLKMRRLLAELGKMAADFGVAVVIVSASSKCELPVKTVWRVDCDVLDAGLRWCVPVRCQCGPLPSGLGFRITRAGLAWQPQPLVLTADRLAGSSSKQDSSWRLREISQWLQGYMGTGPMAAQEVLDAGQAAGWSASQVKRAKQSLRIKCHKEPGERGRWIWDLPNRPPRPAPAPGPAPGPTRREATGTPKASAAPAAPRDFSKGVPQPTRLYGSEGVGPEDPLAWLDRNCRRDFDSELKNKGTKENQGNNTFEPG